jgi:hypothetical protein
VQHDADLAAQMFRELSQQVVCDLPVFVFLDKMCLL